MYRNWRQASQNSTNLLYSSVSTNARLFVAVPFDADSGHGWGGGICMDLLRNCAPFQLQKRIDHFLPILKNRVEFAPSLIAHANDVSQWDGLARQLCGNRRA